MKKLLLLLAIAGLMNFTGTAQERPHCFTTEMEQEILINDPQYSINRSTLEQFTEQYTRGQAVQRSSSQPLPYIIPVVFHVLHNYGPENVPDSILVKAVERMNIDFRKLNADTIDVIPPFKPIVADCEMEFRLATLDPNGNCTNGIEHIQTSKTYFADDNSKLNPWPNNKYLNIWVAASLLNPQAAAYAHLPGGSNSTDGIMCWYTYVDNTSRTLTHEAGHHFNLLHVWGNSNNPGVSCGDDGVSDTPISFGWDHCDLGGSVCSPPTIENVQNFMEYSYCDVMFTQGQKTRMHACLNSAISGRNNLWTPANLIATGTDGSPITVCVPTPDFKAEVSAACINTSVIYDDLSWKGRVTNWNWSFPGGIPSTTTDSNPTVIYPNPGVYNATLTVSNSAGSDSITKNSIIHITGAPVDTIPYVENFEDSASFPGTDGWVINPDNGSTWARVTNNVSASAGIASIRMNNYTNTAGAIDEWITPSMDFSNVNSPVMMSFMVANAQRNSTSSDELKLYYSLDCGKTWSSTSYSKSGPVLSTVGTIITSNFTPNSPAQWRQESIAINAVKLKPNVRFKFMNTSDHGNNTYIDDINITGNLVGVDEVDELQAGFAMYPNPTQGITNVSFALSRSSVVSLEVKDILGQTITKVIQETLGAGMHEHVIPVLPAGIYMIDLTVNNKHHVRKLVVS